MCDIHEGDAQFAVHIHQFKLHILAHLEVERAERFVEEQHFGLVDEGARYRHALLLSAGKRGYAPVTVILEVDHFENAVDFFLDFGFGVFAVQLHGLALAVDLGAVGYGLEFETEGYVVENIEVREKGVTLEHRIHLAQMRRGVRYVLAVEDNPSRGGHFEARYHTERRRFAAARRSEQGDEFAAPDVEAGVLDGVLAAVGLGQISEFDDVVCHFLSP